MPAQEKSNKLDQLKSVPNTQIKDQDMHRAQEASFQNRQLNSMQSSPEQIKQDTQRQDTDRNNSTFMGSEISVNEGLKDKGQSNLQVKAMSDPPDNNTLRQANLLILNEPAKSAKAITTQDTTSNYQTAINTQSQQQGNEEQKYGLPQQAELPRLNIQSLYITEQPSTDDFNFKINSDKSQKSQNPQYADTYEKQGLFSKKPQATSSNPQSYSSNYLLQDTQTKVIPQNASISGSFIQHKQNSNNTSNSLLGVVSPHQYSRFNKLGEADIDQQVQEYSQQTKAILNREAKLQCYNFEDQVACVKSVIGGRETMEDEFSVMPDTIKMNYLTQNKQLVEQIPDTLKMYYSSQNREFQINQQQENYQFYAVYDGHGGSTAANFCKDRLCNNFKSRLQNNFKNVVTATIDEQELERFASQTLSQERKSLKTSTTKSYYSVQNSSMYEMFGSLDPIHQQIVDRINQAAQQTRSIRTQDGHDFQKAIKDALEESFVLTDMDFDEYNDGNIVVGTTALTAVIGKTQIYTAHCGDSRGIIYREGLSLPLTCDHKADRQDEQMRVLKNGGQILFWGSHRLQGVLAMTRSIGDKYLRPYITCVPEITILERLRQDEFIVLASDGLWDVLSNQDVGQIVKDVFVKHKQLEKEKQVSKACQLLIDKAIAKGSRDNITAIVINLQ